MGLTIGLTSMDKATETALRAAFDAAGQALRGGVALVGEESADYVVVDMDSMYGPMGWLRLHAAGKQVVGLTSAPRTQADFHLGRPFDTASTVALLREIAAHAGLDPDALDAAADAAAPAPVPAAGPTPTTGTTADETPAPMVAPGPLPATASDGGSLPEWLRPGRLNGRLRLRRDTAPTLWIDCEARQYFGPAQLKPLAPYFAEPLDATAFEPVDEAAWASGIRGASAHPIARLVWFGGLLAGRGRLLPGFDAEARYLLSRWPQTEREFPRHFRIATAMMKGPATLAEIAEASGTPDTEVADFVNASLATGYAERYVEPPPEPAPPPRSGLFGRFIRK
ncbi:hypothetical protein [Luteimonas huabeiensis]|uniref:hypothetical protein n=1 Tax=Luteimonas huabeiensis TaxID=1244513 RepID=UPI0004B21C5B|nr:hypothetical protein [Luteimonas huabeiensis]